MVKVQTAGVGYVEFACRAAYSVGIASYGQGGIGLHRKGVYAGYRSVKTAHIDIVSAGGHVTGFR